MSPIIVDAGVPVVVGALEGLTLNGLSLNNGTTHVLTALQLPIPAKKPEWVEGADANGAILMRDPLVENGTLVATVDLFGTSKDQVNGLIGQIVDELEEADRNPAGVPVVWTPAGGSNSLTFYALEGEVTQLESDLKFVISNVPTVQITLKCRPGGYGDLVTGPSQITAGPVVQLTVPDVPGDMPTDEAYIVVTDQSSQSRRHVEWGAEWLHHNASTSLFLDSDSLVTSGYSGSQFTWGPGAYNPDGAGTDSVRAVFYTSAWTAILSTGSQTHVGTFRVKARVMASATTAYFRLSWRVGDGEQIANDSVFADLPANAGFYREIDLGLVTVPPVTAGTQSWEGVLEGRGTDPSVTSTWAVDYLVLVPVEAGYGRARGQTQLGAGVVVAADGFAQVAGALNSKTLATGNSWATSGGATDFQVSGSGYVSRTAGGDTPAFNGRIAVAGTTNIADVEGSVRMWGFGIGSGLAQFTGLLLRYVDANNWLGVFISDNVGGQFLRVFKKVSGSVSLVAGSSQGFSGTGTPPAGVSVTLTASVASTGTVTTRAITGETTVPLDVTVTGTDPALATGGTLATGKPGVYSENQGSVAPIYLDNFAVFSVPALTPAMYSGRTLEVTGAETRRQNSAGTLYGTPASYRGSRFTLNPEGSAGRSTRVLAKAHRNDVDLGSEATPVTDSLKLQVFYRPRYSVVPR